MDANRQLSTLSDRGFDDITFLAASICQVPISILSIQTDGKNCIQSIFSREKTVELDEKHLEHFLNGRGAEVTLIPDARNEPELNSNPLFNGDSAFVFYASISLPTSSAQTLVRLSVLDHETRIVDESQLAALRKLAGQAIKLLENIEREKELKRLEEVHQLTKKRLHKIIDAAEVGIWEVCIATGEFRYSEGWAAILGYTSLELGTITRAQSEKFVHPVDVAESAKASEDYRSGVLPRYECELRMKHKNGYWVWVLARGEYVTDTVEYEGRWMVGTLKDTSEQVVANEQIYVREKRFQILLENSEDAIAILNEAGRSHFETDSVSKILGYKINDRLATRLFDLVHPEDLESFNSWFQQSIDNPGKPIKGHISRMQHFDGTWRYISGTLTNLLADPIIKGLIHNFKDVTEQVVAENFRQSIENKYRKLAQEGADLVAVLNKEAGFNYLSPNFSIFVGRTEEEIKRGGAFAMIHPDDVERIKADFRYLLNAKNVRTDPFRFRYQQEEWKWVQSVATNLLDDPDIQGIVVNSADVTNVIEAHKALEQSNERFKLVLKAGSESIYDYDPVNKGIFLNETFEETFGIPVGEERSGLQLIYNRIHPDDLSRTVQEFRSALEDPEISILTREYRLMRGDGTYAYVRDRSIKLMDGKGNAIRVVGALMDISNIHFFQKLLEIEKEFIESSLVAETNEDDLYINYLAQIESLIPGMSSSLTRVVAGRLCNAISPSLPEAFLQKLEGLPIGPNQGSCGSAAYFNEEVFVTDVFQDPRWEDHLDIAKTFGIGSCWSFPIVNSEGIVIATIANYYPKAKKVEENELQALERAHRLISLLMAQYDHLEKIRLSNERYELVTKSTNEAIFDWDVQKDKFYWGESLRRVFGHDYSPDEFNLDKWISLMHPIDNLDKVEEWNRFMDDPKAYKWQNQFRFLKGDGSFAFVEEAAYVIRDETGNPLRMIGVLRDRTELNRMEVLLANASKLSRVGGWEVDVENDRLLWSPITCEIHEVPVDFIATTGEGINFYREDYRERVRAAVDLLVDKGEKYDFEAPIITFLGNERWVRSIGEGEFLDGRCVRLFGSIQDIHERKLMEERLKGVSDSIPGVIFQYILAADGSDEFRYVSKGSIHILGMSPEQCMTNPSAVWTQVAQGGDVEVLRKSLEDSAKSLNFWNHEWRVLSPDGKIRWREGLGTPTRKLDGSIVWDAMIMDVTERKNLENLLEQSARMAKIGSWELDLTSVPFRFNWSASTREILDLDELSGIELENIYRSLVGESKEAAKVNFQNLVEHGIGFDMELELTSGKNSPQWIRCIGQAMKVKGRILSAFGSIQDIHGLKLSELKLKSILQERDTILESIGDGFFAVDRAYIVTYWNQQAEKLLNIPRESILGKTLWDVLKGPHWGEFYSNFQQALESGTVIYFESYLKRFKSWFSISAFPSASGLTVYFKDITENKKAQEEIRQSNERFIRVAEATNDAIWDFQIVKNKLYWGKGFLTRFGYDPEYFVPDFSFYTNLIHPEDRQRILTSMEYAGANPEIRSWNEEYRFKKIDESYAYVVDRAIFSRDEEGNAVRIIGAMSDITESKEYEDSLKILNANLERQAKELAVSNAELEQFAYVASHDLQEPLRMVSSFLSQLDRKYRDRLDDKAKNYIHFAVDGAIRMRQVILDLLEYSRVGKEEQPLEKVNLEEVIFEVTQLQAQLIQEKRAKIQFEGLADITCFRSPILQVFQNLIGNALKYSKEKVPPMISITCREESNHWLLSVKDNGIGIREEYYNKIFVIFQRLHAKQEYTGTGLGLAIVKKIIESLGGRIWLESADGEGSIFHFTIAKPTKSWVV